jgi:hypothetical protein
MKIGKKIKETFTSPERYKVLGATLLTDKEKEELEQISSPEQLLDFISDYNHRLIQEGEEDRFSIVKYKGKQEIYGKTILLPYPVTYDWEEELSGFYSKKAVPFELEDTSEPHLQYSRAEMPKKEITEEEFLAEIGENDQEEKENPKGFNSCPSCGTPLGTEAEFCPRCGKTQSKVEKEEYTLLKCKSCEELLAPGARFCSACGFDQTAEDEQEPEKEDQEPAQETGLEASQTTVIPEKTVPNYTESQEDIQGKFELNDQIKSLLRRSDIERQVSMELEGKKKHELEVMKRETQKEREQELLASQQAIDEKFDLALVDRQKAIEEKIQHERFQEVSARMKAQQTFVSNLVEKLGNFLENG